MLDEPGLALAALCGTVANDVDGPEILRACIFGFYCSIYASCAHFDQVR